MKRVLMVVLFGYVVVAAGNRVAEHFGAMTCGCGENCWCRRPHLSLFRWVFPWGHDAAHTAEEKASLDVE